MAIQTINIGNRVNDGLGDDLRTAFEKVNSNFIELGQTLTITGKNLGSGAGIFKQKVGFELEFKRLYSGSKISLDETEDTIIINNTVPFSFNKFTTDGGSITANSSNEENGITLEGTLAQGSVQRIKDIEVTTDGNNWVRFKTVLPVTDILTIYDFGSIKGNFNNAVQLAVSASNIDFGKILLPGTFDLDLGNI
jgi:hypothetical protein